LKELEENYDYLNTAVITWISIWIVYVIEALAKIAFSHPDKVNINVIQTILGSNLFATFSSKGWVTLGHP
jgi:hypothetical protein